MCLFLIVKIFFMSQYSLLPIGYTQLPQISHTQILFVLLPIKDKLI